MRHIIFLFIFSFVLSINDTSNDTKDDEVTLNQSEEIPNDDQLDSRFTNEWVQKMSDYESTYVYMIPVAYKSSQVFYENITTVPARIRGAFIVAEATKEKIEFKIKGPNAAIFELNVTEKGLYEINFNNRYKNSELRPTFTMNPGQNEILKKKDINKTEEKLDQLISFLKNYGTEDKLKRNVHRKRAEKLKKTNRYFYTFSVIETVVLIGVSAWQFYYMKHLFEIKGSL